MNRKLHQLFQPSLQLYFVCLVVFALASALFSLPLAVLELMVVALLGLYHRANLRKRRREVTKYIENITGTVDVAAKDTMVNSPLPMVIFRPESGDIIWTNDRFLKLTDDGEHLFDAKLSAVIPGFDTRWLLEGKSECPGDVTFAGRRFLVYGHLVRASERGGGFLATTYWVDVTELSAVRDRYQASRPVAAVLLLEKDCQGDALYEQADGLLRDRSRREEMVRALNSMAVPDAGEKIYQTLREIMEARRTK